MVVAGRFLAARDPATVERAYARGLFPPVERILSTATGWVPFSVAEVLVLAGPLLLFAGVIRALRRRRSGPPRRAVLVRLARVVTAAALVVLAFDLLWGFNYDRQPVARLLAYDTRPASADELAALASALVSESAALRMGLAEDAQGALRLPDGRRGALGRAGLGFAPGRGLDTLPCPAVGGRPKLVLLSPLLSYAGISGIFIPFTGEANVNATLPDWEIPFTAAHELAHQHGYAREDEANYVGYRACREHPDRDFQYSGTFQAALYSLSALAGADRAAYGRLRGEMPAPLGRDLAVLAAWRARYQSRLGTVQDRINDAYLKTQGQREGVRSYGRLVDLLLAERRAASQGRPR